MNLQNECYTTLKECEEKQPSPSLVGRASLKTELDGAYLALLQEELPYAAVESFFFENAGKSFTKEEEGALFALATENEETNRHAFFVRTWCFLYGIGTKKDPERAFQRLQLERMKSYPLAQFLSAHCYGNGWGIKEDPKEAFTLCKLLYDQGMKRPIVKRMLAYHYVQGYGCSLKISQAFQLAKEAFEEDNMYDWILGWAYLKGKITVNYLKKGHKHLKKSAENNREAFRLLSQYYFNEGLNPEKGMKYLERGAKKGDQLCKNELQKFWRERAKAKASFHWINVQGNQCSECNRHSYKWIVEF